jgi:hypothetical protein
MKEREPASLDEMVSSVAARAFELASQMFHTGQSQFRDADTSVLTNATFGVIADEVTTILKARGHREEDIWPFIETVLERARHQFLQSWLAAPVAGNA